ncbi:MAG: DUF433 domain-containing protein [Hormoscilla sp. GM7CHS1pb]|nr:DUF433 domain-containing protein [Hormoscilla sp. SP12CHS1]MBC6480029.1 DUF433 domain-containing protein [Hormoscilla sp. GM7CHS1pb]
MTSEIREQEVIIRTERGLTIAGTRITIYDVIYYLKAEYPRKYIRDAYCLTDEQIDGALSYIETHREAVEVEYQEIMRQAEETRQYWEEYNRERFARIAAAPPRPGSEALRLKIMERRMRREAKKKK